MKNKTENALRKEVKDFMDKNNFTANFLGKEIEVHPQTITNWVSGQRSMRIDTLEKIHKFMNKINKIQ